MFHILWIRGVRNTNISCDTCDTFYWQTISVTLCISKCETLDLKNFIWEETVPPFKQQQELRDIFFWSGLFST